MDSPVIKSRAKLLQKYVSDENKELQALYSLQALVVKLDQPASKCYVWDDEVALVQTQSSITVSFVLSVWLGNSNRMWFGRFGSKPA